MQLRVPVAGGGVVEQRRREARVVRHRPEERADRELSRPEIPGRAHDTVLLRERNHAQVLDRYAADIEHDAEAALRNHV